MSRPFIKTVTVSGVSEEVTPDQCVELAKEFPFVEFGIQLSLKSAYYERFPSTIWLNNLVETCLYSGVQFSGHICFKLVRQILLGKFPKDFFYSIHPEFCKLFSRWQINTHGELHRVDYPELSVILDFLSEKGQPVIFQQDEMNNKIVHNCKKLGHKNISALFDTSHGSGTLPSKWPKPLDGIYCGYSGGLTPDNLDQQLEVISRVVSQDTKIWIDAENGLRSYTNEDSSCFDFSKVRRFLVAAQPWVVQN